MTQRASHFAVDWLALRSSADTAARAATLTRRAAQWLAARPHRPLQLIDLGAGSGANPRFLASRLPGPQCWRLWDHDPALLAHARDGGAMLCDATAAPVDLRTEVVDLATLETGAFHDADLVCASALIDLVGSDWIDTLIAACTEADVAMLFTLSVDGTWTFLRGGHEDVDPDDELAREAFNAHQRRDKGTGGALGPDAVPYLAERLRAAGYAVQQAPSPWRLRMQEPREATLAAQLMEGWLTAAVEQLPSERARLGAWHARRQRLLDDPLATIVVGHLDLFASPAPQQRS